jgi:hypothetical protein
MLSGKICGYAKYASKESAEQAIQVSIVLWRCVLSVAGSFNVCV